jgi:sulfur-carrier protein
MAVVSFTANLRALVDCPSREVQAVTVAEALDNVFVEFPRLRTYVLDERGAVREHVIVFLDGSPIEDRRAQSDPITANSSIYVAQALSGG